MFDLPIAVRKKGTPYYIVWTSAFHPKKFTKLVTKDELAKFDIKKFCEVFEESLPTPARAEKELSNRFSLYLTGHLLLGITRVFTYRVSAVLENAERIIERINQPWDTLSIEDEASLSPVPRQRPESPIDYAFDPHEMEEPRPDDDFPEQHPHDEEEPRPALDQQDEQQPAVAAEEDDDGGEPVPRRQPKKRGARKRPLIDEDDEPKRKPRRPRRKNVVANIARHEDITLREDLMDSLERDLLDDGLQPLDEEALLDVVNNHPVQLAPDTVLVINPRVDETDHAIEQQPPHDEFNDFEDYPEYHPHPSPVPAAIAQEQQPTTNDNDRVFARNRSRPSTPIIAVNQFSNEQFTMATINLPTIEKLSIANTPEQARRTRSGTISLLYDREISENILMSPFMQERMRSASPSRVIAINMIKSPEPSVPPSNRGSRSPPIYALYREGSRSATPAPPANTQSQQQHDIDHTFEAAERDPDETVADISRRSRQKRARRKHAREPPVTLPNADILNRDQVYLQKDLQNGKFGRFRARLDDHVNLYKAYVGLDTVVEIGDELKNFLDERIGRLDDVERDRRAAGSRSIGHRSASRLSEIGSGRGTPKRQEEQQPETTLHEEEERPEQQMADPFDHDFEDHPNAYQQEEETPMQQDQPLQKQHPPPFARRSPIRQFQDIEYVEPVPLPEGMEHLLSPPRALPRELFNTSAQRPFKELGCKYDHDDLYWLILYRVATEKKVVYKFSDFADRWPRPYIAKQYHNFLLLVQLRKIIARSVHNVFHSFIVIPNDEFRMNMAKILTCLARDSAAAF